MNKKQHTIIALLSVASIILAILVSGRYWFRLDLTKNKAYTISKVSRNLHSEIPEPVNISYFVSDRLKNRFPEPGEIEDILREFASYSRGKIRFTSRDPVKAGLTSNIEEFGLLAMQMPLIEQDQSSLVTVYSGIVIEYLDKIDVIPWTVDISTLEYDITTRIRAMIRDTERSVGVIVGDSFRKLEEDYRYLNIILSQAGFRVRQFALGEEIPDNLSVLIVLGGVEEFEDDSLYIIDRYIQLGGKVLFALEGVFVDTIYGSAEARFFQPSRLLEMVSFYGVTVKPELVLDRNALFLQFQTRAPSGMIQRRIMRYPMWIGVTENNGNRMHPVTSSFEGVDVYWASPLDLNPSVSVNAEVLFTTSSEGWVQRGPFYTSPEIPYMMELEIAETRGVKILAASLSGTFPGFFKDTEKPLENLLDMPDTTLPSRVIVIGDSDMLTNLMEATDSLKNLNFLTKAIDWLSNDDDIINIRNRQPRTGRLDRITDEGAKLAAMRFSQVLNLIIIPALVLVSGAFLASKRKKRNS